MKITTLNIRCPVQSDGINYWENRKNIVLDYLKSEKSDIICLQEVRPAVKEWFIQNLTEYQFFGDFRFVPQREEDETALIGFKRGKYSVLSYERKWLSPTPDVPESKYIPDTYWPRVYVAINLVDLTTGKDFFVINTHLELDDYSISESIKQLISVIKRLAGEDKTVFITGDFNQNPDFINKCNDGTLVDLTSSIGDTFQGFGRCVNNNARDLLKVQNDHGHSNTSKIDYIFTNKKDIKATATSVHIIKDGIYISDHFPITCEVDF